MNQIVNLPLTLMSWSTFLIIPGATLANLSASLVTFSNQSNTLGEMTLVLILYKYIYNIQKRLEINFGTDDEAHMMSKCHRFVFLP